MWMDVHKRRAAPLSVKHHRLGSTRKRLDSRRRDRVPPMTFQVGKACAVVVAGSMVAAAGWADPKVPPAPSGPCVPAPAPGLPSAKRGDPMGDTIRKQRAWFNKFPSWQSAILAPLRHRSPALPIGRLKAIPSSPCAGTSRSGRRSSPRLRGSS